MKENKIFINKVFTAIENAGGSIWLPPWFQKTLAPNSWTAIPIIPPNIPNKIAVFVPNIGESYITKSILENDNYTDILYDNNGNEVIFSSDGSRINNDEDDGIEIISLEDVPNPESEELF